ncbi:hypothetical protein GCM10009677_06850 [Sphaerisporangium rubeum]|uniref:Uncharacterized protein n=1 Tax=Sphaerisporangium rubeum TaxID=321317 RepID=A0A7X0M9W2_9ACTN|nr:hypothetical protein [Sphaerisporangium rubeum]MBB6476882.1 hypothetical protein [Sphaerisporangium rubeum]
MNELHDYPISNSDHRPTGTVHTISQSGARIDAVGAFFESNDGPVTINPEVRAQALPDENRINRHLYSAPPWYVFPPEWRKAYAELVNALPHNRVVIVVAPRGYGSTTFSLRLLARETASSTELVRLETDWTSPKVGRLPCRRNVACQLDLQDSDSDRFDTSFIDNLAEHSRRLRNLDSYLVLSVAEDLWTECGASVPAGVTKVHLAAPPKALEVVESHLRYKDHGYLIPCVNSSKAQEHLSGHNVIDAVRAVETVIQIWEDFQRQAPPQKLKDAEAAKESGSVADFIQTDVETALDDWQEKLNSFFGTAKAGPQVLSVEDRCLLLALGLRQRGVAEDIQADARELEDLLKSDGPGKRKRKVNAYAMFSGPGLRTRMTALGATIDRHDHVTYKQTGFGEAALLYVWENYADMRDLLVKWMIGRAKQDRTAQDPAIRTLIRLLLRAKGSDRLSVVRDEALRQNRHEVIVHVMADCSRDEHMGRRTRALLYDWAGQRSVETQRIVIRVCQAILTDNHDVALVRLCRIADSPASPQVQREILSEFRKIAKDSAAAAIIMNRVVDLQRKGQMPMSSKLALLALMDVEHEHLPWLLTYEHQDLDVMDGLRELLADLDLLAATGPPLIRWFELCAHDLQLSRRLLKVVADALRRHRDVATWLRLIKELDITLSDGSTVKDQLGVLLFGGAPIAAVPVERADA